MSQAEDDLDDAEISDFEEEANFRDGVDVAGRCVHCGEPKRYCLCHFEN